MLILPIFAAATDACDLHKYATASTRAVRNEVKDRSGKSVQSVPSVLLSPEGGNRPSANSHTAMGTGIRLTLLIMLISETATAACTGGRPQAHAPSETQCRTNQENQCNQSHQRYYTPATKVAGTTCTAPNPLPIIQQLATLQHPVKIHPDQLSTTTFSSSSSPFGAAALHRSIKRWVINSHHILHGVKPTYCFMGKDQ